MSIIKNQGEPLIISATLHSDNCANKCHAQTQCACQKL